MFTIIQNNKKQILIILLIILLLPVILYIQDVILTLGKITGTAVRMYFEGICIK